MTGPRFPMANGSLWPEAVLPSGPVAVATSVFAPGVSMPKFWNVACPLASVVTVARGAVVGFPLLSRATSIPVLPTASERPTFAPGTKLPWASVTVTMTGTGFLDVSFAVVVMGASGAASATVPLKATATAVTAVTLNLLLLTFGAPATAATRV